MISNDAIRRNMAVFSISVVSKLTDLTPRQIIFTMKHMNSSNLKEQKVKNVCSHSMIWKDF